MNREPRRTEDQAGGGSRWSDGSRLTGKQITAAAASAFGKLHSIALPPHPASVPAHLEVEGQQAGVPIIGHKHQVVLRGRERCEGLLRVGEAL